MGILNFYNILRTHCKEHIKSVNFEALKAQENINSVAIDGNGLAYKFSYVTGDAEEKKFSMIHQFSMLYIDLLKQGITSIWIFDSAEKHPEKQKTRKKRDEQHQKNLERIGELENLISVKRAKIDLKEAQEIQPGTPATIVKRMMLVSASIEDINDYIDLQNELRRKKSSTMRIPHSEIMKIADWLKYLGASVLIDKSEAEGACSIYNRLNYVDAVISDDADTVIFGTKKLIRCVSKQSSREFTQVDVYDIAACVKVLNINQDQLIDLAILAGCDFCPKIPKMGVVTALKSIQQFNTIENIIKQPKIKARIPEDFDYKAARHVFSAYLSIADINDKMKSALDLSKSCNFSPDENLDDRVDQLKLPQSIKKMTKMYETDLYKLSLFKI